MSAKEKANEAIEIIMRAFYPRGVGHTHAALHGVLNTSNSVLVVHNEAQGQQLKAKNKDLKYITLRQLPDAIRGMGYAVVFDNFALQVLIGRMAEYINELETEIEKR